MKPLSEPLLKCCGACVHASVDQLLQQEPDDRLGAYSVYWASDGLLLLQDPHNEEEGYFLSHSDLYFVLDRKSRKIGIRPPPKNTTAWILPLCNMVGSLVSRTILDKDEVPRCNRLVRMAEEPLIIVKRKVPTEWIIS